MKQAALGWLAAAALCGCPSPELVTAEFGEKPGWAPKILAPGAREYLPDFSYAGYREGEAPLPAAPITHHIADFGALPDDGRDDTAAFRQALSRLARAPGSAVLGLARGRYLLKGILFIERGDFVLRGAGSGANGTVLALERPLDELPRAPVISELESYLKSNNKLVDGKPFSAFSWTGGLLWTRLSKEPPTAASERAVEGRRGARELRIAGPPPAPGSSIELRWLNRFGSASPVLEHLFGLPGPLPGERLAEAERVLTSQLLTVERSAGDMVWVKQPLRHDVRPDWEAVWAPAPQRLEGVGLERFRIDLPDVPYAGHHLERGYNALYLTDLRDSFVRDVVIHNADSAILTDACERLTLSGVQLTGRAGHYGIHLGDVESVLVQKFSIEAPFAHSLSFNTGSRGSVFSRGQVKAPRLDQHRGRNHQNLFDAISGIEEGPRSSLFEHGGADYWGPTHGAFNTFWNISLEVRGPPPSQPLQLAGVSDAGPARLVGIHANVPLSIDYPRAYQEGTGKPGISVPSLYEEQLRQRLKAR